jgi:acetyl esterase/lipase
MRRRSAVVLGTIVAVVVAAALLSGCGSSAPLPRVHGLVAIWGKPPGGEKPRALVLLIHGGSWKGQDTRMVTEEAAIGHNLQHLGYETLAFDYRHGAQGIQDAQMFYELARKRVGPGLPICAMGMSAGAHIALMLAVKNSDLACVVDLAGPTDLTSLARQPGGKPGYALSAKTFGVRRLPAYSPALHARSIRATVLAVYAQNDPIVPPAQGQELARALPGTRLIVLPPGSVFFVHSTVDASAFDRALAVLEAFLKQASASSRGR